jgi:enoyl-CoA hydratase/carnithine racemase
VVLQIDDDNRVRTLTLNRPDVLNAFNEELYLATATALRDAATDPEVAVVLLTGAGRAFSAGNDLKEMQRRITDPAFNEQGSHFSTMIDALTDLPKPLICAVNGVGVGIGATILGYADLVFISSTARLKTPFTSLGVAPEAASSYLLPRLMGRQNAAWLLMSSEWVGAAEAAGLEGVRTRRSAARGPSARRNPCLPANFELDGGQADDRRTGKGRDRRG